MNLHSLTYALAAAKRGETLDILGLITWLFSTRDGVVWLLGIGVLGFLIAAIILERKTRQSYQDFEEEDE